MLLTSRITTNDFSKRFLFDVPLLMLFPVAMSILANLHVSQQKVMPVALAGTILFDHPVCTATVKFPPN